MVKRKEKTRLAVKVRASARERKVERVGPAEYKVSVISPASQGKANREVVETLASYFNIAPSQVKIIRGETSRRKLILLEGLDCSLPSCIRDKDSN